MSNCAATPPSRVRLRPWRVRGATPCVRSSTTWPRAWLAANRPAGRPCSGRNPAGRILGFTGRRSAGGGPGGDRPGLCEPCQAVGDEPRCAGAQARAHGNGAVPGFTEVAAGRWAGVRFAAVSTLTRTGFNGRLKRPPFFEFPALPGESLRCFSMHGRVPHYAIKCRCRAEQPVSGAEESGRQVTSDKRYYVGLPSAHCPTS